MKRMNFTFNQTLERNPNSLNGLIPLKNIFSKRSLSLIFLFFSVFSMQNLHAQNECTWESPIQIGSTNGDGDNPGELPPVSYTIGDPDGIGDGGLAGVSLTDPLDIKIKFWGDMDGSDEGFKVNIDGNIFDSGNFGGANPTLSNPQIVTFTLTAAEATAALSDGEIEITYDNFESNWSSAMNGNNQFFAQVQAFSIDYEFTFNSQIFIACEAENAIDLTQFITGQGSTAFDNFSGTGVIGGNSFDPSVAGEGIHLVNYNFECED
jgi:hypothetical protein